MSRLRGYAYGAHPAAPPGYYYDDTEGYVGDYSESDGLSETPRLLAAPTDVTEIYRRKPNMPPPPEHYRQNVYVPTEYYYDTVTPQPVPRRAAAPMPYRKRIPVVNERNRYYPADAELYDQVGFRSSHQIGPPHIARNVPPRIPSATALRQTVRRRPITVRTPRYYRRPAGTTLYKRPSTLCLPVGCQPDPAVYRRSKRMTADQMYQTEMVYQTQTPTRLKEPLPQSQLKPEYRKLQFADLTELNITRSKLDAALERYEQIFEKNSSADSSSPNLQGHKLAQMLRPRIPTSIKEKQQKTKSKKHRQLDISKSDALHVEEIASDALEEILLADLTANGLNDAKLRKIETNEFKSDGTSSPVSEKSQIGTTPSKSEGNSKQEKPVKDVPKSFNYQDIQKGVVKSQQQQQQQTNLEQQQVELSENSTRVEHQSRTTFNQTEDSHTATNSYSPCRPSSPQISCTQRQQFADNMDKVSESVKSSGRANVVPRVLVDDALELHRTKSYVVNLIDHALSNHFGTNLCEKYSTKDNPVDHRIAMEILKKHSSGKMDKDLCMEIAQALADTFHSSTSCSAKTDDSKQDASSCSCSKIGDEPLYVKQLKQLRWGHLKHIQREVRRLEDLERFLDTCTSNSFV